MTAWTVLLSNSTVPDSSTAWIHLNNQGSGGSDIYICVEIGSKSLTTQIIETDVGHDLILNKISTTLVETIYEQIITNVLEITSNITHVIDSQDVSIDSINTIISDTEDSVLVTTSLYNTIVKEQT